MKVKALRAHDNQYGTKYHKNKGDEYEHPRPAGDIASGVVEPVEEQEAPSTTKKSVKKKVVKTGGKPGEKTA